MRFQLWILICILILTGCIHEKDEPVPVPEIPNTTSIHLTPIDLSQGEVSKLRPFLGTMSGAFKLEYEGAKPKARLDIDIWEKGQKVETRGSVIDLYSSTDEESTNETEVIISIETVRLEEDKETAVIKVNNARGSRSSLSTFTLELDTNLATKGLVEHTEPQSYAVDQPIYVFAMQATSTNQIYIMDLTQESLSETEWALVFTLRFDD
ncbi:hypothetical protein ACFQ3J_15055 [Paenibacillus provencensis]|uniref:Uncharacterized protein n=1 Tax=Paenibacillus provencensis TaxID=441151 RepID=A0ABW3PUQ4_9BACL|nr:hypothetical protein [Paenibacillus sp. MER 78]MCM3127950.1 hypothetical protein [Paenibacillus sp. MER 78]